MAGKIGNIQERVIRVVQNALGSAKTVSLITKIEGVDKSKSDLSATGVGRFELMCALEKEFSEERLSFTSSPAQYLNRMNTVTEIVVVIQELLGGK